MGVANPQSWGRGSRMGPGIVPFERALGTSYRHSIVTFPLSVRVSEIMPLLCSSMPLFPTPPLFSPKFPQVNGLWATKSIGVGLNVREISFQDFQHMWSQSTNVTDRRTDRRHAIPIPRFALFILHRVVKTLAHHLAMSTKYRDNYHVSQGHYKTKTTVCIVILSRGASNTSFIAWRPSLCGCWTPRMEQFTGVHHWLFVTSHLQETSEDLFI